MQYKPLSTKEITEKASPVFNKYNVSKAALFGSCVFRANPATYFGKKRPPISGDSGHLFRFYPATFWLVTEMGGRFKVKRILVNGLAN